MKFVEKNEKLRKKNEKMIGRPKKKGGQRRFRICERRWPPLFWLSLVVFGWFCGYNSRA